MDAPFLEGDKKSCVFQVVEGTIALYRILHDGRRQIVQFAHAGDVFGLGWGPAETCNAQATDRALVKSIPVGAVRRAAERDPHVGRLICDALVMEIEAGRDHMVSLGQDGANARVARFLLALGARRGEVIQLTMTRGGIGDYLGLTLESVSRAFSHPKRQRVIQMERATNIRILDRTELEQAAKGEDGF